IMSVFSSDEASDDSSSDGSSMAGWVENISVFHLDRENTLSVSLFSDVTNSKELLSSILDGTLKLEVSFLNALLITESLKRCGISESCSTYILAARFNASPLEMEEVAKLINGKEIDLEELKTHANQAHMLKHYKITSQELGISSLEDAIVCRISARDAL
ncbi:hypothetical protein HID58_040320, partial [Brassica napus]